MLGLIARRFALGLVTVWLVSVIIFLGVEALPGDACTAILERDAHGEALAACREADLFVLPSRIAADGDRDGLPNVLMEAQSQGLACIATNVSAIPELIVDGETGVLVPPDDPDVLSGAIAALAADPDRRIRLGRGGEARVRTAFSFAAGVDRIAEKLGARPANAGLDAA